MEIQKKVNLNGNKHCMHGMCQNVIARQCICNFVCCILLISSDATRPRRSKLLLSLGCRKGGLILESKRAFLFRTLFLVTRFVLSVILQHSILFCSSIHGCKICSASIYVLYFILAASYIS